MIRAKESSPIPVSNARPGKPAVIFQSAGLSEWLREDSRAEPAALWAMWQRMLPAARYQPSRRSSPAVRTVYGPSVRAARTPGLAGRI